MKKMMIAFIRILRAAGVAVTTREAVECLHAWRLVDFNVGLLHDIMELTLVKSQWERPVFQLAFELYFFDVLPEIDVNRDAIVLPAGSADGSGQGTAGAGGSSQSLLECLDGQAPPVLEALARNMTCEAGFATGSVEEILGGLRKIQVNWGWFGAINIIERRYQKGHIDERIYRRWLDSFEALEQALRRELYRRSVRQFGPELILPLVAHANIRRRDFNDLSGPETIAVEQEVVRLARKLAQRPGIRMRRAKRGKVDISQTLRRVVGTGGCPLRLQFKDKIKSKVELWLLCDVSNSVERFSRFMLQLVHAAQKRYVNIRTFVFVDDVVDVTAWFQQRDVAAFLQARALRELFSRTGFSRYDQVFEQLARQELAAITPHTKIMILGDARNNWLPGGRTELAKIAERAQAIYWLNPLPQEAWQQGDCILEQYGEYCRQVFECRNLEQLADVATRIL